MCYDIWNVRSVLKKARQKTNETVRYTCLICGRTVVRTRKVEKELVFIRSYERLNGACIHPTATVDKKGNLICDNCGEIY